MDKKTKIDLVKLDSAESPTKAVLAGGEEAAPLIKNNRKLFKVKLTKKSIFIYGIAGLVLLGGSAGAAIKMGWITLPGLSHGKEAAAPKTEPLGIGPILKLNPLIINLKEEGGRHYIKTTIVLEITKKDWLEEIKSRMSLLTDMVILTLCDKQLEDLKPPESKEHIKQEILNKIHQHFDPRKIKRIYFDEFLYQ